MADQEIIPHLFRTEYRKIVSVICKLFGIEYIEIAEDIVSDTFLVAAETWGLKGLPYNPTAWLYSVSKNKTIDYFRHHKVFTDKISVDLKSNQPIFHELEIDLSSKNIIDSQLEMIFAICNPCINAESQIGLALNILCGFGAEEIADAFLTSKEAIYKRMARAKEKLRLEKIKIEMPSITEIDIRLENVLSTLYLLFSEGYYSASQNTSLKKEFCIEAMRLNLMLVENEHTNQPKVSALLALMCFHSSRFDARQNSLGEMILYEEQDETLWNKELIEKGVYYLNLSSKGNTISKYHIEAAIAYWHTNKADTKEKWEQILQLYNKLLLIQYSPIAALNRTYALSKANSKHEAIIEAEKLALVDSHLYFSLLGNLYQDIDRKKSLTNFQKAFALAKTKDDQRIISNSISKLNLSAE
ncbi:MAG TPA: sigma factor [Chitinophagaceae bacterium]|nr:sigma factor [Chitinophagaceae bacterium]